MPSSRQHALRCYQPVAHGQITYGDRHASPGVGTWRVGAAWRLAGLQRRRELQAEVRLRGRIVIAIVFCKVLSLKPRTVLVAALAASAVR